MAWTSERLIAHRRTVIALWIAIAIVAGLFASRIGGVLQGGADAIPGSDSDRATRALERAFGRGALYQFLVVLHDSTTATDDPRYIDAAARIERALAALPAVRTVETPWNCDRPELIGDDWHTALIVVTPRVETFHAAERLTFDLRRAVAETARPEGFVAAVTGAMATLYDLDQRSSSDLLAAERVGLPVTLVILLAVFGTPLAALLPLVLALVSVSIGLAGLWALHPWLPVSVFAENVVSMIGLGVGIDYALFVLSRHREEVARGLSPAAAAVIALRAAGHSVAFSGATVIVGFLALFLVRAPFLHAIAIGGMIVVAAAVAASMTLLPALLAMLGPALHWPRRAAAPVRDDRRSTLWMRWAELVMRRPWPFLAASSLVLLIFVVPVFRLQAWNIGATDLHPDTEARRGHELLAARFPDGWTGPIIGVVEARDSASVWSPGARAAIADLGHELEHAVPDGLVLGMPQMIAKLGTVAFPARVTTDLPIEAQPAARRVASDDGRIAVVALVTPDEAAHPATMRTLHDLRARQWPALEAAGLIVRWGGSAAVIADFDAELFGRLPLVIGLVVFATFIVLAALFRSILIPLKATLLNVLSVLAAYGFLVLVFQDGHGARLLGIDPPGGLNSFIVLMLFTILFGLSMDYEVFLLARVREEYLATGDNARAVAVALGRTARIITCAALIMISIFASFGFTRLIPTREFGLGLAFAVALDATVIRMVLVPALMVVSGKWNWWWPWK